MKCLFGLCLTVLAIGCGGDPCSFNSDCVAGSYCEMGRCTSDCSASIPCPGAQVCTSFGRCVDDDAGAGADAGSSDAGTRDAGTRDAGCDPEETRECTTECESAGTQVCSGGRFGACAPPVEVCNATDDDCDGTIDNGFRAALLTVSYSDDFDPALGCTAPGSLACSIAAHRYCAEADCTTSGFGPVESAGDNAWIGCVVGDVRELTFEGLSLHESRCSETSDANSPPCNAAIHRYCASEGHVTGFGPILTGPDDDVTFTCLNNATIESSSFAELAAIQPLCDGVGMLQGIFCSSAINRLCEARGYVSGFGPLEWGEGGAVAVACVDP
jgi:hypothetical protein